MATLFYFPHLSTPQPQLWNPSFSSPWNQPQSPRITRENAQIILPTDACIHVGNLPSGLCMKVLQLELEQLFFQFGTCWAQVREGKRGLLSGWVQFTQRSHAQAAIEQHRKIFLRQRPLRVQAANGLSIPSLVDSTDIVLSNNITGNRVEPVARREERAGISNPPLYMPSMALPSSQPTAYGPTMQYSWSPALPVYGGFYVPPPPPPPVSVLHTYIPQPSFYPSPPSSNTVGTQSTQSQSTPSTQPTDSSCNSVVVFETDQDMEGNMDNHFSLPCDMPLSTGRTIRDYVNDAKRLRGIDLSEEATCALISEMEEEARNQGLLPLLDSEPD
ncbi:hypothetical protein AbraIFM66950_007857 [Aspergillus brasiliensis]|nr:hypothetical protein AbraIFM66950_007857 [Aspergillus brasiliensis]